MGSGSSKAGSQAPQKSRNTAPQKPVANVNKQENVQVQPVESSNNATTVVAQSDYNRLGSRSPIKPIETNKRDSKFDTKETKKDKKEKLKKNNSVSTLQSNPSQLQFEDDSDFENDIDEVLKIPVANDNSRQSRDREKKNNKDKNKENIDYDGAHDYNRFPRNVSTERSEELPETYAQRLQRQQYKLQQNMLLREKTIVRNPKEWQLEDENDDDMDMDSPRKGFDASKFRQVNKGGDIKKDIFNTVPDDLQTPRYLQSSGQDLDEFDVRKREDESPNRQLPRYNQSELDLMQQLENELL